MKKISILIIESSAIVRTRLKSLLEVNRQIGHIFQASGFSDGIDYMETYNPQVVVLDVNLPDGKGLKNLYELKQSYPDTKIIVFTNKGHEMYAEASLDLGANYFLDKSYDFQKLPAVLDLISNNSGYSLN